MRYLWIIPLLAWLAACKQEESRPQPTAAAPAAAPATIAPDARPALICFGDSLTAGFGVDPGHSYPDLLQQDLDRRGLHYRVVNLGESGDTTQDGLDRLALVTAEKPRLVIVEFGANDGLRGQPVASMETNLAQIIEALQKTETRVVLAGITLPPNYGPEYIRRFSAVYPELAARYKVPLIPFLLEGAAGHTDLMQQDGLHPNTAGTRLVAANVLRVIEPLLPRE
jgi:acyl-CoA thioesterase-1